MNLDTLDFNLSDIEQAERFDFESDAAIANAEIVSMLDALKNCSQQITSLGGCTKEVDQLIYAVMAAYKI